MASKRFSKVSPAVWRSKRFTSLSGCQPKLLYLYFITSEHQTSIGAYAIPTGYAVADLGWGVETYEAARKELEDAGLIIFDEDTSVVYVERWFKHSPPQNMRHAQGCQRLIGELESEMIAEKVQADFEAADIFLNPPTGNGNHPFDQAPPVSPALMNSLNKRAVGGRNGW